MLHRLEAQNLTKKSWFQSIMAEIVYSAILYMQRTMCLHASLLPSKYFSTFSCIFHITGVCGSNKFGVCFKEWVEIVTFELQMVAAVGIQAQLVRTLQYYLNVCRFPFCSITHLDTYHFKLPCSVNKLFLLTNLKGFPFPTKMKQKLISLPWQSYFTKFSSSICPLTHSPFHSWYSSTFVDPI